MAAVDIFEEWRHFDVLIHSTPARTKGHAFEIALHEELWGMVAQFKKDLWRAVYSGR
jgi:hypothetical protein